MEYTWWERAYFKVMKTWPESVVRRRIEAYDRDLAKRREEQDKKMEELRRNPPPIIPDGVYVLKVVEGEIICLASGRQALRLRAIVCKGEHTGHEMWSYLVMDHPPAAFVWEEAWQDIDAAVIVDSMRRAEIRTDEYMKVKRNMILKWLPLVSHP